MKLTQDYLLLKILHKDKTDGGIVLPDSAKSAVTDLTRAKVIQAGPGMRVIHDGKVVTAPMQAQPGNIIIFMTGKHIIKYGRDEKGEDLYLMQDVNVIGIE